MIEHSTGWDCPVALVARLDHMDTYPPNPGYPGSPQEMGGCKK